MPHIESGMRDSIAEFLPRALDAALDSYLYYSEQQITDTESTPCSKAFKEHHDACKVALAHIDLLIKLAKWADLPDPKVESEDKERVLLSLIQNAQGELA